MVWGNLFSIKMMRRETDKLEFSEVFQPRQSYSLMPFQSGLAWLAIEAPEYPRRLIPSYWSIAHFSQPLTILEQAREEYLQGHKQARFFRSIDVQNPMYPDSS